MKSNSTDILAFPDVESFKNIVADTLKMAQASGASQAEAGLSVSQGLSVAARMRKLETIEHQQDNGLGISVYFGQHKGSASTSNLEPDAIRKTVEAACNIARYTSEDPCTGLADAELMAQEFNDLDLYHPWEISAEAAIELALECESAALDFDDRIINSEGASVDINAGVSVYGNTHGFLQSERKTRHSISCSVLGESDAGMQRDYWYEISRNPDHLTTARAVGLKAAERTVKRLDAQKLKTQQSPVLFVPEIARGLIGHFTAAIGGSAQYRKASFLLGKINTRIFPEFLQLVEYPFESQALGSANFDSEGVIVKQSDLVTDGVIQSYLLDSYAARKLGLQSTGHASGVHNLTLQSTGKSFDDCVKSMHRGLLVTELMGHGVNTVTGDYSRGAAGFWVEKGEVSFPVEEITIAANLKDMFAGIVEIGDDFDMRGSIRTGSIMLENMTIAGTD
ncbi:MAG: metalloprotease PmbA [Gammaproteobacteria bacterium]|nr:metalloprotease PmbA [Gammaproteobacteria bacterium]MCZ6797631.1 metalloprotease PmbA [Gammaproteobacteria bacterium]